MYSLLVVDDEKFAAGTIAKGIDWSDAGIGNVYEAYCALDAMDIFRENRIDVLICDIEMPGDNGLQLLEWVNEHYPNTQTLFLTGHANFTYAQKAVQLDSFDYLLKPVDYDQLKEIVRKALSEVRKQRETDEFYETYKKYYRVWESQIPMLVERFWQDVLGERKILNDNDIERACTQYNLDLSVSGAIFVILLSVDEWKELLNSRDEEIMKYAVRNVAGEIFLEKVKGAVIQDHDGNDLVLLYDKGDGSLESSMVYDLCKRFIHACNTYLHCSISCYMGDAVRIKSIVNAYYALLEIERNNMGGPNRVIRQCDYKLSTPKAYRLANLSEWLVLLETGKKDTILRKIGDFLADIQGDCAVPEILESLYYTLLHSIYQLLHKKGLSVYDLFNAKELSEGSSCTRTVTQFKGWVTRILTMVMDYLNEQGGNDSAIIEKVKQYIHGHLHENFSREDIAAHVYLNASYLSRLFKKETGVSLSDYIMQVRMDKARVLLSDTNKRISDIAETLGYYQFSHFTRMFKKNVGISPQEYRKKFQSIGTA